MQYVTLTFDVYQVCHGVGRSVNKNSSGDEIANVNFFYDHIVQYLKI